MTMRKAKLIAISACAVLASCAVSPEYVQENERYEDQLDKLAGRIAEKTFSGNTKFKIQPMTDQGSLEVGEITTLEHRYPLSDCIKLPEAKDRGFSFEEIREKSISFAFDRDPPDAVMAILNANGLGFGISGTARLGFSDGTWKATPENKVVAAIHESSDCVATLQRKHAAEKLYVVVGLISGKPEYTVTNILKSKTGIFGFLPSLGIEYTAKNYQNSGAKTPLFQIFYELDSAQIRPLDMRTDNSPQGMRPGDVSIGSS